MSFLEHLGHIRLYENDWDYSSGMDMEVEKGKVYVIWRDHVIHKPDMWCREVRKIDLELLLKSLNVTEDSFIQEMQSRFAFYDGIDKLCAFLDEHGVEYNYTEYDRSWPPKKAD